MHIEGIPVQEVIKRIKDVNSLEYFLKFAISISEVVSNLHKCGIIHGDINENNILIGGNSLETLDVILIDFENSTNPNECQKKNSFSSDLYALGTVLYELSTGNSILSLSNGKHAKEDHPNSKLIAPHNISSWIPEQLSKIILKLLNEDSKERYQTAEGLGFDLKKCYECIFCNSVEIKPDSLYEVTIWLDSINFPIAMQDHSSEFYFSQRLYDRQNEMEKMESFLNGLMEHSKSVAFSILQGDLGIGKTTFLHELEGFVLKNKGIFFTSNFEEIYQKIPYSAIFKLILNLLDFLQNVHPKQYEILNQILKEIDINLSQTQSIFYCQDKFFFVIQNIFEMISKIASPILLNLENLQWADNDSLDLMKRILSNQNFISSGHLFVTGTYSENISNQNNFKKTLKYIQKKSSHILEMHFSNLSMESINEFISKTFHKRAIYTKDLSIAVFQKTKGNPMYVKFFLKYLYKKGIVFYSPKECSWNWSLNDVLAEKAELNSIINYFFESYTSETHFLLSIASCVGREFDLQILSNTTKKTISEVITCLSEPIKDEILQPLYGTNDTSFCFVQEAYRYCIYSSLSEDKKEKFHLQIGNSLLDRIENSKDETFFVMLEHFNRAKQSMNSTKEVQLLFSLNFHAGIKATDSTAYKSADYYFENALYFSQSLNSQIANSSILELYNNLIDSAYRIGHFKKVNDLCDFVNHNTDDHHYTERSYITKIKVLIQKNRIHEAEKECLDWLRKLDIKITQKNNTFHLKFKEFYIKYFLKIQGNKVSNFSKSEEPKLLTRMSALNQLIDLTIFTNPRLFRLSVLTQLELSVRNGHSSLSILSYLYYSSILFETGHHFQDTIQYCKITYLLLNKLNFPYYKPKVYTLTNLLLLPWKFPLRKSMVFLLKAYKQGIKIGDFQTSYLAISIYSSYLLFSGQDIKKVETDLLSYQNSVLIQSNSLAINFLKMNLQVVFNLTYRSSAPSILTGNSYSEENFIKTSKNFNFPLLTILFYLHKIVLSYLFDSYAEAFHYVTISKKYIKNSITTFFTSLYYFYESLVLLAMYETSSFLQKRYTLKKVSFSLECLKKWSENSPENFLHKYHLVKAEKFRVTGKHENAKECYEIAIDKSLETTYLNEIALIFEVAGKFYLKNNNKRQASYYLQDAYKYYRQWGVVAKTRYLESKYNSYINYKQDSDFFANAIIKAKQEIQSMDIDSIISAAQAISSEIVMEKLLNKMMILVLENANADEGALVLGRNDRWVVEAEGNIYTGKMKVLQSLPLHKNVLINVSTAIIEYAIQNREIIILNNPAVEGNFTNDPYIKENKPKSILCLPLQNQGKIVGILFLVNHTYVHSFTPEKIKILKILSTQMAISLENSYLYSTLEQKVEERTSLLRQHKANLKAQIENTTDMICSINRGYRLITFNSNFKRGFERFFGFEILINMDILLQLPTDFKNKFQNSFAKAIGGEQWMEELSHIDPNTNELYFFEYSYNPITNDRGIITGVTIFIRNITERKKAEEELRILSRAVEQSGSIIFITNLEGIIEFVNPAFSETSGYSSIEAIGSKPSIIKSGEHSHEFYKNLWKTIKSGETWKGEILNRKKNGELYWEYTTISPVKNKDGIPTHYLAITEDITERIKKEKELKTAKENAELANRAKSEFLTNISHEIRTPMNAILGFAEILKNKIQEENNSQYIKSIVSSAKTLLALINDVLDLSKAESGKLELKNKTVQLHSIFYEIRDIFAQTIEEKKIEFIVEIDPKLPETLILDEIRIRQILLNLVGNAVKFTDSGRISLKTFVKNTNFKNDSIDLDLVVEDTGMGIPPNEQNRIFEAFVQVTNQDHAKYGGTGLGLSICQRLVELMNGTIKVTSQIGLGSTFIINLKSIQIGKITKKNTDKETYGTNKSNSLLKIDEEFKSIDVDTKNINLERLTELVKILDGEIRQEQNAITEIQDVNQIEKFIQLLKNIGEEFNWEPLKNFSKKLNSSDTLFDIEKFLFTMEDFNKIVIQLKKITGDKI
ncbi:MAG: PAS domain S-box protein [Leptospiraceae bacterium]|nr:PAS domain S-box protein [Leptospiraceae bacterium]